jgi:translation initiation factor eIF-2B subunit epsilon
MAPKGSKPAVGKSKPAEESKEDPLQAVVLADTFENRFAPFTLERPRCLLPLMNVPLIEYTLEFLASVGVQEVFVYAGAHVDQVETYIDASQWRLPSSPFRKLAFLRSVATSVGDVMRDLDQKHILVGDFIIVSGDVVSDFPISAALKKHKARREKDKNAIMTMLLRETTSSPTLSSKRVSTFVLDPATDRCLHYEESATGAAFGVHVDPEILKSSELDIRQDLVDCRIDICTPDVLSLWSDNFDNQAPRKDFLFGVLKDYELNGKTIHTYIAGNQYAARVADLPSYVQLSRDVMDGSVTALQIGNNVFPNSHYTESRQRPRLGEGVIQSRPVYIDNKTLLGSGTSVGAMTRIKQSVFGQRCHIGKATSIEGSYVWDDVLIGDNVTISRAIIGSEVSIGDNCTIGEGALISFGVKITNGTEVPPGVKITRAQSRGGSKSVDELVVGAGGEGCEYSDDEDEDAEGVPGMIYAQSSFAESASTLASDLSEPTSPVVGSRSQSFATNISEDDVPDRFQHDTVAILLQRMQEGKHVDDMLSELMGLRFSGGADETQVRKAVAGALARRISSQIEEGMSAAEASRQTLTAYKTLIRREQAEQSNDEQVEFLLSVQHELTKRKEGGKVLLFLTKDLYDLEVLGEEPFLSWWINPRSSEAGSMAAVRAQTEQFIQWLKSAESESEEDEDEDDAENESGED